MQLHFGLLMGFLFGGFTTDKARRASAVYPFIPAGAMDHLTTVTGEWGRPCVWNRIETDEAVLHWSPTMVEHQKCDLHTIGGVVQQNGWQSGLGLLQLDRVQVSAF